MEVKTQLRHLRMAPRKVRLVVNAVRGLSAEAAVTQLRFMKRLAAIPVRKLIESGIANAEQNNKVKREKLWIKSITVGDGLTLKRWKPRAMGRAVPIRKRASHVIVVLSDKAPTKVGKTKVVANVKDKSKSAK